MTSVFNIPKVSVDYKHDSPIINKMFLDVNLEFINQGWKLHKNTLNEISYINPMYPTDEFKIKLNNKLITVTVPVMLLNYEYSTTFNSYFQASEYLLSHLENHSKYYSG